MPANRRRRVQHEPTLDRMLHQRRRSDQPQQGQHPQDVQPQTENITNKRQQPTRKESDAGSCENRPRTRGAIAKSGINNNSESIKNNQHRKCDSNQGDVVMTYETRSKEEMDRLKTEKLKIEHVQKNVLELLENDLCCAICREIYINPVILNCSHSFCKFCLNAWLAKHDQCPSCRIDTIFHAENLALRDIVSKMVVKMPAQYQEARVEAVKAREKQEEIQDKTLPSLRPRMRNRSNEAWTANGTREFETRPIQRWTGLNGATIWRTPMYVRSRRGGTDDDESEYDEDWDYGSRSIVSLGNHLDDLSEEEGDDVDDDDVLDDDAEEDVDAEDSNESDDDDSDVVEMEEDEESEEDDEDDDEDGDDDVGVYPNPLHGLLRFRINMDTDDDDDWPINPSFFDTDSSEEETSSDSDDDGVERITVESFQSTTTSDDDSSSTDKEDESGDDEDFRPRRIIGRCSWHSDSRYH